MRRVGCAVKLKRYAICRVEVSRSGVDDVLVILVVVCWWAGGGGALLAPLMRMPYALRARRGCVIRVGLAGLVAYVYE